jgi:hypothetical protein
MVGTCNLPDSAALVISESAQSQYQVVLKTLFLAVFLPMLGVTMSANVVFSRMLAAALRTSAAGTHLWLRARFRPCEHSCAPVKSVPKTFPEDLLHTRSRRIRVVRYGAEPASSWIAERKDLFVSLHEPQVKRLVK